jgi:GNAT superfamily N-acetyltransferase
MTSVEIRPVRTREDLEAFIRLPFCLYRDDPHWVPPLLSERRRFMCPRRNPFFDHAEAALWLARRNGEVVGTISSHIDHLQNQVHGQCIGMFGFFETVDDYAVAADLLAAARDWSRARGMTALRGPLSFSQNHTCGLLVEGDPGPPMVLMPHNPAHYAGYLERFGLCKAKDLYAYCLDLTQFDRGRKLPPELPRLVRVAEMVRQRTRATLRRTSRATFRNDMEKMRHIYNQAWRENWGFVPMTEAELGRLASDLGRVFDPALAVGAEIDGEVVGISIAVPDINQVLRHLNGGLLPFAWLKVLPLMRSISQARLMLVGVLDAFRGQGIETLLILETLQAAARRGYQAIEFSWVLEDNQMANRLFTRHEPKFGARRYRTYRIYEMPL